MASVVNWIVDKTARGTDNTQETQDIEDDFLAAASRLKVVAVALGIFALIGLYNSLPSTGSLIRTTFGCLFAAVAYDCWKVATNIQNEKDIAKGLSSLKKIPHKKIREKSEEKRFEAIGERILKGTIYCRLFGELA